jgi:hypothetical protein
MNQEETIDIVIPLFQQQFFIFLFTQRHPFCVATFLSHTKLPYENAIPTWGTIALIIAHILVGYLDRHCYHISFLGD